MRVVFGLLSVVLLACGGTVSESPSIMSASDAMALPQSKPDHLLAYGEGPLQVGELRLP